jgi:pilus assembly protein Flp/PilA
MLLQRTGAGEHRPVPEDTGRETAMMKELYRDQRGANLVEYIILVGVVALIALAGFKIFGFKVRGSVDNKTTTVQGI